jgi:cold-inducible RNA-binding protein
VAVRLFIGNLPYSATEVDVRAHMATVAPPTSVVLPMDRETGRPRGFAFVDYDDLAAATEVIRRLNGNLFLGRTLSVSEARPREERGPRPPFGSGPGGPPRMGPPLGGPARMGPSPTGAPGSRERNFGPPAPPKGKARGPAKSRGEGGPKGPIKVRGGGRVYDVDEDEELKALEEPAEVVDFDDIATAQPEDDAEGDGNE